MSVLQEILNWDRELFNKLNGQWTNSFFDFLLPFTRNAIVWAPLYLFFILYAVLNYRSNGLFWVLMALLTVATSDLVSSWGMKELIYRVRPCGDESLVGHVRFLVQYCPHSSSFTSSHATNHFAMAFFIFQTLKKSLGKWLWLIFLWAFIISYAQVYVGVHYPLDTICGAILGAGIGLAWSKAFNHRYILD
ncbi:MAG TPA: phosphatase PAP2 family protein [Chitinophagaceae bacterium]|nr:phosphatase PAP2 family protein [Chitinophagaceae bacterium]